ncbi:TetR/AcrR family transcriptional regulator [Tropicimonas isoalkanivorans]|uniref:Transcriptional regulator, TetR family n=1 Tax=Tropicimonas isoalkanivorans TaxID=441112 RepID=A0A1I1HC79_9RHOB|nr:TetR/AcrR family transcriptional regulator [Tropicimonas isoalkanivorans]SFC21564.1 transcriptional regulator, TetR family [Tropicimonas isoalkanivorans]
MTTLRARQKNDRRKRIVAEAKTLFRRDGYDKTTIENIAEAAGVSGVTVHNYYGTKAGVLLALVIENDALLIDKLEKSLPRDANDIVELTLHFARGVMDHAIAHLDKQIWRQVIAAVTVEANSRLSKAYFQLDHQLAYVLVQRLEGMQKAGRLPVDVDVEHLGKALFHLQNARFIQFISSDDRTEDEIETRLRNDLTALLSAGGRRT